MREWVPGARHLQCAVFTAFPSATCRRKRTRVSPGACWHSHLAVSSGDNRNSFVYWQLCRESSPPSRLAASSRWRRAPGESSRGAKIGREVHGLARWGDSLAKKRCRFSRHFETRSARWVGGGGLNRIVAAFHGETRYGGCR